jgi:hypothetical protein
MIDSVDIGGYWGGWEGGVVVESGWGSVPLGEGISYGGGTQGTISSDIGFSSGSETPGLGPDGRSTSVTSVCAQGGVPPTCPEGQKAVWDQSRCAWICGAGGGGDSGGGGGSGGSGSGGGGGGGPLDRVADVIERVLGGGGGGIIIPQIPQPQAVVAPATERRYNPAAIVLLVAGLALGGYYVYQRTRRS